ncbi:MAG: hypothetical protein WC655_20715, partial [Candidatus Hydrogenedentales bacterium]
RGSKSDPELKSLPVAAVSLTRQFYGFRRRVNSDNLGSACFISHDSSICAIAAPHVDDPFAIKFSQFNYQVGEAPIRHHGALLR